MTIQEFRKQIIHEVCKVVPDNSKKDEFVKLIKSAVTFQELSDIDQCLDTWKYGY